MEKDPFYLLGNLGNGTLLFRDTLATSIIRKHLCAISAQEPGILHCNQADVAHLPLTEKQIGLYGFALEICITFIRVAGTDKKEISFN